MQHVGLVIHQSARHFITAVVFHYTALRQIGHLVIPIPSRQVHYLARRYNQSAQLALWLTPADDFAQDVLFRRHHN